MEYQPLLTDDFNCILQEYYQEHYEKMIRYVKRRQVSSIYVEDMVQMTFLIACIRREAFLQSDNREGWLYRTLGNVMRNMTRKEIRQQIIYEKCRRQTQAFFSQEDTFTFIDGIEVKNLELLFSFYLDGYSHQELAERYCTTVPAIKMRLQRTKRQLRRILQNLPEI